MKETVKIAISGVKNSGKTSLIEKLIPELKKKGIQTAVIKHDGHDFEPDVPGTDSDRVRKAGAFATAVFSASKYLLVKERGESGAGEDEEKMVEELSKGFPEADLILLEGFKKSNYPKLELVRKGNSERSVCPVENLLAIVSDFEPEHPEGIPLLNLNDPKKIADFLEAQMKKLRLQEIRVQESILPEMNGKASCKIMLSGEDYYFGPGVYHLLQRIQETGSIRSAAMQIGLSYTKACKMLNRAEKGSGVHFLEKTIGGRNGGKSVLTREGQSYMEKYERLLQESQRVVSELYKEIFTR